MRTTKKYLNHLNSKERVSLSMWTTTIIPQRIPNLHHPDRNPNNGLHPKKKKTRSSTQVEAA